MSVELRTQYLGFNLKNPLVVGSSPLTGRLDALRRLEDAGASAVVLPSLFEEQIAHDRREAHRSYEHSAGDAPEVRPNLPEANDYNAGPDRYLKLIEDAKKCLSIPVIGSLNGMTRGGWVRYARLIREAGADALELNIYYVCTNPDLPASQVETLYFQLVAAVRDAVRIPLAVKIGPYFSSLPNLARCLVAAGADGLVLFNRFLQPDVDLGTLRVAPKLVLSTSDELRLPLRWIAILRPQLHASLAATTGVHTAEDVLKLLLAGADVAMLTSALYKHGFGHLRTLLDETRTWMEGKGYASVEDMKGSLSQENYGDPDAFERANYIMGLVSFAGTPA